MNITLNGEAYTFTSGSSISDLLKTLDLEVEKVAIERNMEILPHSLYDNTHIVDGDNLEIVHFIGGG